MFTDSKKDYTCTDAITLAREENTETHGNPVPHQSTATRIDKLEIVDHESNGCVVPPGESRVIQAFAAPEHRAVVWSIVSHDVVEGEKIKADIRSIGPVSANIEVDGQSPSGWITVRAADADTPSIYKEARVFIGDRMDEGGDFHNIAGSGSVHIGSIDIGLGNGRGGASAGHLFIQTQLPKEALGTLEGLMLSSTTGDLDERYHDDHLRQIMAPECLVDIRVQTPTAYRLVFYRPDAAIGKQDSLFEIDPDAKPTAVWCLSACGQNKLIVTEQRDGKSWEHIYAGDRDANRKTLSKANGSQVISWKEERTTAGHTAPYDLRRITETIKDRSGNIASQTRTAYRTFAWGEEIVEVVVDPDDAALTTATEYDTDSNHTGSYGRIAKTVNADGAWQRYQYDQQGRIIAHITPWRDSPDDGDSGTAHAVTYAYEPVTPNDANRTEDTHRPRTITHFLAGQIVSKTYHAYTVATDGGRTEIEERCSATDAQYDDITSSRTVTTYYPSGSGQAEAGRIKSFVYPDGRMDSYQYDTGIYLEGDPPGMFIPSKGNDERTIVVHGTVDQPEGVAHKTTRDVLVRSSLGHTLVQTTEVYNGSGYDGIDGTVYQYDVHGRMMTERRSDGGITENSWTCCGKASVTDAAGLTTRYTYDDLKRVQTSAKEGLCDSTYPDQKDTVTRYTYDAAGRVTATTVTAGALTQTTRGDYDRTGRQITETDAAGLKTTYDYSEDGLTATITHPGNTAETTSRHLDGRTATVISTAAPNQYYRYGVYPDGSQWTEVRFGTIDSPMYQRTTTDMLGRTVRIEKPGPEGTELIRNVYDVFGRLSRTTISGQADTLYSYDALGNVTQTGLDVDADGVLEPASADRITACEALFIKINGRWWHQTTTQVYPADKDGTPVTISTERKRLTGLIEDGRTAESVIIDIHGNITTSTTVIDRAAKTVIETVNYPDSAIEAQTISVNGLEMQTRTKTNRTTTFAYDDLGRQIGVTDPRTGTSEIHYDEKGRVAQTRDADGNLSCLDYDAQTGQTVRQTDALGKITRYAHNARGQVTCTWGDVPHPVRYEYDEFGRMTAMHTYRDGDGFDGKRFPANAASDITRWHYDPATGLLSAKAYADGSQVTYTYTTGGKLKTRSWARLDEGQPVTTTYNYAPSTGELIRIDYSDATDDITFDYDRLGRQTRISDAAGTHTFAYNAALQPATETVAGLCDATITRRYDRTGQIGRATGFNLDAEYNIRYGFDDTGRFNTIDWEAQDHTDTVIYNYLAESDLLHQLSTRSGRQTTYTYEADRNLITGVRNDINGIRVSAYDYSNNPIGCRTTMTNSGSAFAQPAYSHYSYNDRRELITARRYLGNDPVERTTPVTAELRRYQYDPMGNRTAATQIGLPEKYQVNDLNQYTDMGSSQPVYDMDGNLVLDTDSTAYTYNAENRLIAARPQNPTAGDIGVEMVYDYMGRRVQKVVSVYGAKGWTSQQEVRFVYDGWNMIKETTSAPNQSPVDRYYVRGLDVSQSLQGAGGVEGLLAVSDGSSAHHYLYDANGNVAQLADNADGSVAAHYEYDAFGNTVFAAGDHAEANPYRFSTKYFDAETDLYYYGYRYYTPASGRWVNRDPIGENGGLNIYGFSGNSPNNMFDLLGLDFIALAARELSFLNQKGRSLLLNHLSVENWVSPTFAGVGKEYYRDHFKNNHSGAIMVDSVELLPDDRNWFAEIWTTVDDDEGPRSFWDSVKVSISVITYNTSTANRFAAVFEPKKDNKTKVSKMWDFVRLKAKDYPFAEQAIAELRTTKKGAFNGFFKNWPNSNYFLPGVGRGNNSNSFARWVVTQMNCKIPNLWGFFPGSGLPTVVSKDWSSRNPILK